jgi:hypothetical protein
MEGSTRTITCVGFYSEVLGGKVAFRESYANMADFDMALRGYKERIEHNELSRVEIKNGEADYTLEVPVREWDPAKGPWNKPIGYHDK